MSNEPKVFDRHSRTDRTDAADEEDDGNDDNEENKTPIKERIGAWRGIKVDVVRSASCLDFGAAEVLAFFLIQNVYFG